MEKKGTCIDVRTGDGKTIFSLVFYEKEISSKDNNQPSNNSKTDGKKDAPQANSHQSDDPTMTDAQKRYLFRLLAEQGKEGDDALKYLKKKFQVDNLKQVTKQEASQEIEQLLAESKGGADT